MARMPLFLFSHRTATPLDQDANEQEKEDRVSLSYVRWKSILA